MRARGKERRRAEIVAAAAALWRRHGIEAVSLQQVAEAAEVAPQTIYNLIGGVDAVVFAVIETLLDKIGEGLASGSAKSGVERVLYCVRTSADMFVADGRLYRQLIVRIPQAVFSGAHLGRDITGAYAASVAAGQVEGDIDRAVNADVLGRQIHIAYLGALFAWASGGLDDGGLRRSAETSALALLTAAAAGAERDRLAGELRALLIASSGTPAQARPDQM
ncbi:hypothetical protein GCM10010994_46280 [Chelatococcus reniformis]|uniref:HTH tetR-type domain-containing protein n=1 Tax=Chelatococcus reniformis TaxID=1494448 RepID=A0A916UQN4_9HYPH|nr:hypothetical protein GCM10010994_46280 [Chelatococcus reniformis]